MWLTRALTGRTGPTYSRILSIVSLVICVVGPFVSATLAWLRFSSVASSTKCVNPYVGAVVTGFLILISPAVVATATAITGAVLARSRRTSSVALATIAIVVACVTLAILTVGGGLAGLFLVAFDDTGQQC